MFGADSGKAEPKLFPERIWEAREASGFTGELFAEHLGVSRQAIAQYETGQISPSGEVISKIIALTGQPPSFFSSLRNRSGAHGKHFWRSLKRMEAHHRQRIARRLEWARDIADYIERFIEIPPLKLPRCDFNAETDDLDSIEMAAEAVRDLWKIGRSPIRDISQLLEANGFVLIKELVECRDMDAVSCWQGGRPFILYAAEVESGPRARFNLAHELAHVVLHSDVEINSKNIDRIEKQANYFASCFLMPRNSFSREIFGTSLKYFISLKERWGVSIAAMAYRCREIGILNENQFVYLMKQMNLANIRTKEPLDELFQPANPSVLSAALKMLIANGVQTKAQIEDALCLNLADIEKLSGTEKGYLDTKVIPLSLRARA